MTVNFTIKATDDKTAIDIKMQDPDNGMYVAAPLPGNLAGALIDALAKERALLIDSGIPQQVPQGAMLGTANPSIHVIQEPFSEAPAIAIRDLGKGWAYYALTDESARKLIGDLQKALDAPKQSQTSRPS